MRSVSVALLASSALLSGVLAAEAQAQEETSCEGQWFKNCGKAEDLVLHVALAQDAATAARVTEQARTDKKKKKKKKDAMQEEAVAATSPSPPDESADDRVTHSVESALRDVLKKRKLTVTFAHVVGVDGKVVPDPDPAQLRALGIKKETALAGKVVIRYGTGEGDLSQTWRMDVRLVDVVTGGDLLSKATQCPKTLSSSSCLKDKQTIEGVLNDAFLKELVRRYRTQVPVQITLSVADNADPGSIAGAVISVGGHKSRDLKLCACVRKGDVEIDVSGGNVAKPKRLIRHVEASEDEDAARIMRIVLIARRALIHATVDLPPGQAGPTCPSAHAGAADLEIGPDATEPGWWRSKKLLMTGATYSIRVQDDSPCRLYDPFEKDEALIAPDGRMEARLRRARVDLSALKPDSAGTVTVTPVDGTPGEPGPALQDRFTGMYQVHADAGAPNRRCKNVRHLEVCANGPPPRPLRLGWRLTRTWTWLGLPLGVLGLAGAGLGAVAVAVDGNEIPCTLAPGQMACPFERDTLNVGIAALAIGGAVAAAGGTAFGVGLHQQECEEEDRTSLPPASRQLSSPGTCAAVSVDSAGRRQP